MMLDALFFCVLLNSVEQGAFPEKQCCESETCDLACSTCPDSPGKEALKTSLRIVADFLVLLLQVPACNRYVFCSYRSQRTIVASWYFSEVYISSN